MRPLDADALPLAGTHLIEASAGTGKTYTIATLVLRLVVEAGLSIDRILVVTFTRAATAELRDRIRRRLVAALATAADGGDGDPAAARLTAAVRDFDTAPIFTIHGFCQRVLQEFAFESGTGFEAALEEDDAALRREIVADYWARQTYAAPEALVAHLVDKAKVTPTALDRLARALAAARGADVVPSPDDAAEGGAPDDLDADLAAWRAAVAAARPAMAAGRAAVEAILVESPALQHKSYSRRNVPTWLEKLSAWLATPGDPTPGAIADVVARFRAAAIADAVKPGHDAPAHPLLNALDRLAAADTALGLRLAAAARRIRLGLGPYLARETRLRRERANTKAFDDLLHDLADALDGPHGPLLAARARARYAAALIDEFQDTDDVQYRIFRALFGAPTAGAAGGAAPAPFLALIGDPKQAIYAFRGADVQTYLRAAADAGEAHRWTLRDNWRSDHGLVDALNVLWSAGRVAQPFLHPGIDSPAVVARHGDRLVGDAGGDRFTPLTVLRLPGDDPEAEIDRDGWLKGEWAHRAVPRRVAADIARLLAAPPLVVATPGEDGAGPVDEDGVAGAAASPSRPLAPGDVAVLTRTHHQAAAMARALDRLGIPNVVHGEASVFDTDEADALARVLAAVAEPGNGRLVRGALATRLLGADAARLEALAADEAAWEAEVERFRGWLERWQAAGFIQAFRRIVDEAGVAQVLLAQPDGERRLTNLQHLAELLHAAAHADDLGPRALLTWLARLRSDPAARGAAVGDSAQLRLERDTAAVQIATIHRSKGLEYGVVYCPFLWHTPPLRSANGLRFTDPTTARPTLDIDVEPDPAHKALAEADHAAEDLRVAYVALTRAKHHCAVVWGPVKGAASTALARLLHPLPPAPHDAPSPALLDPAPARDHAARRLADPGALDDDLAGLAGRCGGDLAVRDLVGGAAPHWQPAGATVADARARRFAGTVAPGRRRTSYSALTAARAGRAPDVEAVRDHDAETADAAPAADGAATTAPPAPTPAAATESASAGPPAAAGAAPPAIVPLHAFPAGADPGTCLHTVFERIDFRAPDGWPTVVADACRRAGLSPAAGDALAAALPDIVATRLADGPGGFALRDIGKDVRLNEMPFVLPLADARRGAAAAFDPAALAGALAADGAPDLPPGYVDAVGRLGFPALRGHLSGYVDMVARVDDRWYVFDWKSNRLGPSYDDYSPERIAAAMVHHHYHLQYHLYSVAVRRYLARRVPGFGDDQFGGVFYLFVRGIHPDLGPRRGVFFARPSAARLDRLDAALDGALAGDVDDIDRRRRTP